MEDYKKTKESTNMLDNKHFWAAFLNLARHNIYITVNHINKILGEDEINPDGYEKTIENAWNEIVRCQTKVHNCKCSYLL